MRVYALFLFIAAVVFIFSVGMDSDDENRPIEKGDLVVIISTGDRMPVPDCPPGLVVCVKRGIPSTGYEHEPESLVCEILWRGFIDGWCDIEWLVRVLDDGKLRSTGILPGSGNQQELEKE